MNTVLAPKTHHFTPFFGKNASFHSTYLPKTINSASFPFKSAKFYSPFSPKTLNTIRKCTVLGFTTSFQRQRGVFEKYEYLGEFEKDCRKCWLYCFGIY